MLMYDFPTHHEQPRPILGCCRTSDCFRRSLWHSSRIEAKTNLTPVSRPFLAIPDRVLKVVMGNTSAATILFDGSAPPSSQPGEENVTPGYRIFRALNHRGPRGLGHQMSPRG